jgi:hypothetical protein
MWPLWGYNAVYSGNSLPDSRILMMGGISCSETSVKDYHYTMRNNPEECRSHLLRGAIVKS